MAALTRRTALAAFAAGALRAGTEPIRPGEIWRSEVPADCPFPQSEVVRSIRFTGRQAKHTGADTWYPSWAADGNLYSPWTDGRVGELRCNSDGTKNPQETATGHATIVGDDPLTLAFRDYATYPGDPRPYGGRYPCGSLVYNGVWFYGTYCLMDTDGDPAKDLNWDVLGPTVGFRHSRDFGKTWIDTPHSPRKPLFGEPSQPGKPVKMGAVHFVDFGRNMQHSPDGKAYVVGHGATVDDQPANLSWITGDAVFMGRVEPSAKTMDDAGAWEYFAGRDRRGRAQWTRALAEARPIAEWNNRMGCVTMTYNPALKRYLMFITDGGTTISAFDTYVLESTDVSGPWRMATFMKSFGQQAYFVNLPSRFVSEDGRTAWLCYSANFSNPAWKTNHIANPPGSGYGMCLQEIRFES